MPQQAYTDGKTAEPRCQGGQVLEHHIRHRYPGNTVVHHLMQWALFHFELTMEPVIEQDYFSLLESKAIETPDWGYDWTGTLPHSEMPIWQYTTTTLDQHEASMPLYGHSSPISSFLHGHSPYSSTFPSPSLQVFDGDSGYPRLVSEQRVHVSTKSPQSNPAEPSDITDIEELMEDEDSDNYSWEPKSAASASSASSASSKPRLKRRQSNKESLKNAKRTHTIVEKNYRERLNDKIADLATYLFETSSDSRTKPSKSLVMTRAKERLRQLEAKINLWRGRLSSCGSILRFWTTLSLRREKRFRLILNEGHLLLV
ncbi:hypothetical protein LCER1_G005432 [Lachnellula cervina]|uniref:BHLH domain-containing protein n=1 Tax=Lachnellula cervina TaxID=1316786 RepID=A0A7D8YNP9_9HELO|nr:hypothetical protein LCER1_G005432 [Lachnellula cervina]